MFKVRWTHKALKSLEKFERDIIIRIIKKVEIAKENPYFYLRKLVKEKIWRLRVGHYRVLFDIDAEKEILYVLEVGHRKEIYK